MRLVCTGRRVRRYDNQPRGQPCGASYDGLVDSARVAGWRVGLADPQDPDGPRSAMCPSCARPCDPDPDPVAPALMPTLPGL